MAEFIFPSFNLSRTITSHTVTVQLQQQVDNGGGSSSIPTTDTGNKQVVAPERRLISLGAKPMRPDTLLEPGRIYFLLPYSALQADMSPLDYAAVAKKLTALAKTGRSDPNKSPGRSSPVWSRQGGSSPVWSSPSRSPSRFADAEMGSAGGSFGAQRSVRARSWKPILDPIREKSFHRRSESELQMQESNLEALKVE